MSLPWDFRKLAKTKQLIIHGVCALNGKYNKSSLNIFFLEQVQRV